jgi:hypothetical protein
LITGQAGAPRRVCRHHYHPRRAFGLHSRLDERVQHAPPASKNSPLNVTIVTAAHQVGHSRRRLRDPGDRDPDIDLRRRHGRNTFFTTFALSPLLPVFGVTTMRHWPLQSNVNAIVRRSLVAQDMLDAGFDGNLDREVTGYHSNPSVSVSGPERHARKRTGFWARLLAPMGW